MQSRSKIPLDSTFHDTSSPDVTTAGTLGKGAGAVDEASKARLDTEDGEAAHGIGELAGPLALVVDETLELLANLGLGAEVDVALEAEDTGRGVEGLAVVLDIPDAGGAVLGGTGLGRVDVELLAGRVGTEESGKVDSIEALVLEESEEAVTRSMHVGQETIGRGYGGIFAADEGLHHGAQRAGDDGVGGGELDGVGNTNSTVLGDSQDLGRDVLETVVLRTVVLLSEDQGAVSSTEVLALSGESGGPGAGIVEGGADGGAGIVIALAGGGVEEHFGEVLGHGVPDGRAVSSSSAGAAASAAGEEVGGREVSHAESLGHGEASEEDGGGVGKHC